MKRQDVEKLMFGTGRARRFTQDSPVLPDVWLAYADALDEDGVLRSDRGALHLLLTPYTSVSPGAVRLELWRRLELERERKKGDLKMPRVIYNQSTVSADLTFEELVRTVIPLTKWWKKLGARVGALTNAEVRKNLARAIRNPENPESQFPKTMQKQKDVKAVLSLPPDVFWLVRVVGALELARRGKDIDPKVFDDKAGLDVWLPIVDAVAGLVEGIPPSGEQPLVYVASLNRPAWTSVRESRLAIKADAAQRVFNITCDKIRWAVLDCGIDARHPAFRTKPGDRKKKWYDNTRIVATYDFRLLRGLLDPNDPEYPPRIAKLLKAKGKEGDRTRDLVARLKRTIEEGDSIDWKVIEPLIRIPHGPDYIPPVVDHGTHVAGILGANWDEKKLTDGAVLGICPDIQLYDMRIVDEEGVGEDMTMSAMQFLRWLNSAHGVKQVHGANLSISIKHDVANYACGQTPVCNEADRLVSSGVVVVAAAGNYGYRRYATPEGRPAEAYNSISIVDPGNADGVITVGATHRSLPFTYGVSYFSSRGPTGDGRVKPDLVAPGEKITAPVRDDGLGVKDGTSMATPHVSGAAALLMARHAELVGNPIRIKEVLCATATDLGRERYFQGHGMLDVLRALRCGHYGSGGA